MQNEFGPLFILSNVAKDAIRIEIFPNLFYSNFLSNVFFS